MRVYILSTRLTVLLLALIVSGVASKPCMYVCTYLVAVFVCNWDRLTQVDTRFALLIERSLTCYIIEQIPQYTGKPANYDADADMINR